MMWCRERKGGEGYVKRMMGMGGEMVSVGE